MSLPFDFASLSTLVAVAETGGVQRSAARLGRTPSAVSMQLKRLEERLAVALFVRHSTAMTLTPAGERFYAYAKRLCELAEEARVAATEPGLAGTIHLGLPEWLADSRVQNVLSRFMRANPNVRVQVRVDTSDKLRPAVANGDLNLALAIVAPSDSIDRAVYSEPLRWVVASQGGVPVGDVMPLVLFNPPCPYREVATKAMESCGWHWRETFTSASVASVRNAVENGIGVSVVPESAVHGSLRVLDEGDGFPALPKTHLALYTAVEPTRASRELAAYIRRCVREITRAPGKVAS